MIDVCICTRTCTCALPCPALPAAIISLPSQISKTCLFGEKKGSRQELLAYKVSKSSKHCPNQYMHMSPRLFLLAACAAAVMRTGKFCHVYLYTCILVLFYSSTLVGRYTNPTNQRGYSFSFAC